ncbi:uncharacterized protein [Venturia canescens]|uniref:uncharacterized protein n=1 Tax=Venturia canescens TaxID=32260 RepID=UPI001C9CF76C|nr:uncharacterized protein LOC122408967 [Venturia canescens]
MSVLFVAFIFGAFSKIGIVSGLRVYIEDISLEDVDSEYFDVDNTDGYVIDNTISTNLTVIKQLPDDTEAHFKISGLSMGKYTLPTGVDVRMPICEVQDEPIILGPFFSVLGFSEEHCPPEPGNYHKEGYTLPMENLPDDFPNNKYQALFEITAGDESILSAEVYCDVQT